MQVLPLADTLAGVTASLGTQVPPIAIHLIPAPVLRSGNDPSLALGVQSPSA